jgi:hypothetical protein
MLTTGLKIIPLKTNPFQKGDTSKLSLAIRQPANKRSEKMIRISFIEVKI